MSLLLWLSCREMQSPCFSISSCANVRSLGITSNGAAEQVRQLRESGAGPNAIARQLTKVAFYNSLDRSALARPPNAVTSSHALFWAGFASHIQASGHAEEG